MGVVFELNKGRAEIASLIDECNQVLCDPGLKIEATKDKHFPYALRDTDGAYSGYFGGNPEDYQLHIWGGQVWNSLSMKLGRLGVLIVDSF